MINTQITKDLKIKYPLIQGGMVWVSGAKLAAACSNAGILGVIGAGSMNPELLDQHIKKCRNLTKKPFAVNLPLLYKDIDKQLEVCLNNNVKIIITSAGSPKKYTKDLQSKGVYVIHVTSSLELALKCEEAGVNAVVIEGFEAGGHNGREELTSLVLIPKVAKELKIPVIAAGGFSSGESIYAGLSLGAEAIQMGTRFMMSLESSAHEKYKDYLKETTEKSTKLMMKKYIPVRLVENDFSHDIQTLEDRGADKDSLTEALGRGRAKKGMLEGDIKHGELEAGQVCGYIEEIKPVGEIIDQMLLEFNQCRFRMNSIT